MKLLNQLEELPWSPAYRQAIILAEELLEAALQQNAILETQVQSHHESIKRLEKAILELKGGDNYLQPAPPKSLQSGHRRIQVIADGSLGEAESERARLARGLRRNWCVIRRSE